MRLTNPATFLAAFILMAACAYGQDVHYNYDRSANFAAYKTYQWVDLPNGVPDQLIDQAIRRAADEQLAQKGLTRVESDGDLYVGYQFVLNLEKSISVWDTGGAGPWGWGSWGGGRSVQGQTSTIPVGILLMDLYDVERKQLVWRGDAIKTIELKKDPNKNYKSLQKVMAKLFKNYPPTVGK